MNLLSDVTVNFNNGTLDVHQNGNHLVSQPYNSATDERLPFVSREEAMTWLETHYANFFEQPAAPTE